jgi:hypothetical protein
MKTPIGNEINWNKSLYTVDSSFTIGWVQIFVHTTYLS